MIKKGDLSDAVCVLVASYLPGLACALFLRPDVIAQYLSIMTVIYVALLGFTWTRRARRAAYYQRR